MNIAEFLLARIAEEEADARAATPGPWTYDGDIYARHPNEQVVDYAYDDNAPHIARWDPARVLAECEAKRAIVEDFVDAQQRVDAGDTDYLPRRNVLFWVLDGLARVYAQHPDYRENWLPALADEV